MSIFGKKQELSQTGRMSKPEKMPAPIKEVKKDTSIFGKESSIKKIIFERRLKDPKLYLTTRLAHKEMERVGKELFGSRIDYIKSKDIPEIKRQLQLGKGGKFKDMSFEDRRKAKVIIEKVLEK